MNRTSVPLNNLPVKIFSSVFVVMLLLEITSCTRQSVDIEKPNQRYLPKEYSVPAPQRIDYANDDLSGAVFSRGFAQGEAVYAEFMPKEQSSVSSLELFYCGRAIPVAEKKWGYRALFCVPPEIKTGPSPLIIRYKKNRTVIEQSVMINAADGKFKVYHSAMDLGNFSVKNAEISPETLAFIERCTEMKKKAFAEKIEDQLSSSFAHPRDMHYITSDFYSKRVVAQYKLVGKKRIPQKSTVKIHWGTDFRGAEGTPVYAVASGTAALADLMHYEGNMIILDHGNGIFTYYMHMASIAVKPGEHVHAGQKIGTVGSTGMSTGPHLHVSFFLNGEHADPLSLLCLPVKD